MAVTVAVNGDAVHHIDIDDSVTHRIADCGACFCHGFQEFDVKLIMPAGIAGSAGMNPDLAPGRCEPDGDVLDCAAIAGHGMPFEMGQYHIGIVIGKCFSDEIAGNVFSVSDRKLHPAVFVKNLERSDFCKSMIFRYLIVLRCCGTGTGISGVAFNDRGVEFFYKSFDQFRPQIVGSRRFAGRKLDACFLSRRPVERFIDFDETF